MWFPMSRHFGEYSVWRHRSNWHWHLCDTSTIGQGKVGKYHSLLGLLLGPNASTSPHYRNHSTKSLSLLLIRRNFTARHKNSPTIYLLPIWTDFSSLHYDDHAARIIFPSIALKEKQTKNIEFHIVDWLTLLRLSIVYSKIEKKKLKIKW